MQISQHLNTSILIKLQLFGTKIFISGSSVPAAEVGVGVNHFHKRLRHGAPHTGNGKLMNHGTSCIQTPTLVLGCEIVFTYIYIYYMDGWIKCFI